MVPAHERISRYLIFSFFPENLPPSFFKRTNAKNSATRFRKKLFCVDGKSPAILTNAFINAKQNADIMINKIPLYRFFFSSIAAPLLLLFPFLLLLRFFYELSEVYFSTKFPNLHPAHGCPHLSYLLFFNKATWIFLIVTLLAMPPFGKIRGIEVLSNVML